VCRKPTTCWSSPRTATGVHEKTTTGNTWRACEGDGRTRRAAHHPVVRDRARRGADLLAEAARGREAHPGLPVYVDSPMALEALARYTARLHELDPDCSPEQRDEKAPLGPADRTRAVEARRATRSASDSCARSARSGSAPSRRRRIAAAGGVEAPAIIISASGMATGGRVLNHLRPALPDPRNTVLFVGFQAAGTRGRRLVNGEPRSRSTGDDSRGGHHRRHRIDVGARRLERDPAVAARLLERRRRDVPRARRARPRWTRWPATITSAARMDGADARAR
jgi:hypothetical protein